MNLKWNSAANESANDILKCIKNKSAENYDRFREIENVLNKTAIIFYI